MRTTSLASIVAIPLLLAANTRAADTDLHRAAAQFRDYCVGPSTDRGERLLDDVELPKTSISQAQKLLTTLRDDGSWPDIHYESKARSSWTAFTHLTRVLSLAVYARRDHTDPAQATAAIAAADNALAYWAHHDFKCLNWWYNDIGVPKILGTIALLLDPDLPADTRTYITDTAMSRSNVGAMTGQNRVWLAGNGIMRGLLTDDAALVAKAADVIQKEILISAEEGIQPDWSFHQHGPQQQFGNYGEAFATDIVRWAVVLRQTHFAVPPAKLEILRNYLLQGQNWVTWRGSMDISACGRQLFPHSPRTKAGVMSAVMLTMALVDTDHAGDYRAFATRNDPAKPDAPNDLLGVRAFYDSDYVLQRAPDIAVSLKMHSDRVIGGETVNSENLSGNHLADGATFFYRTGDEYADIFPVWDWHMIPGTTSVLDDSPLIWPSHSARAKTKPPAKSPAHPSAQAPADKGEELNEPPKSIFSKPKGTAFVGGLASGDAGLAAMDFQRDSLHAHKAWFFSNSFTACLGAGISAATDKPVVTTINQCLLNGPVAVGTAGGHHIVSAGPPQQLPHVQWVDHAGLRYLFPDSATVTLSSGPVTGNWKKVFDTPSTPKADITTGTFSLSLDHGAAPAAASYAYFVVPSNHASDHHAAVLANTPQLQAVEVDGSTQIVFWSHGGLSTSAHQVKVDRPCLVMLTNREGRLFVSVADPTHGLTGLTIHIDGRASVISLPQHEHAGATVTLAVAQP